ncbi:MAG: hypothetical protein WBB74_01200, partial [Gaiellaceae bacterium]
MASYPELRRETSPARTGRFALPGFAVPLIALPALLVVLVLAAYELAVPGGKQSTATPAFLTRALGVPQTDAPLVRKPARGTKVTIGPRGYTVAQGGGSFSLTTESRGGWRRYAHGASRRTPFGLETITVDRRKTEESLLVTRRHGRTTWRWRLSAPGLRPRITSSGALGFVKGHLVMPLSVEPVKIFDVSGRDVTPGSARWSLGRRDGGWWLELRLDDSKLPLPYVIDPITYHTSRGTANASTGATTLALSMPNAPAVSTGDYLVAQVTWKNGTSVPNVNAPSGWAAIGARKDETTSIGTALWGRLVTSASSEPASYTWSFFAADGTTPLSAVAVGGITAYSDVESSGPIATASSSRATGANNNTITVPSVTTAVNNTLDLSIVSVLATTTITPGTTTERLGNTQNSGGLTTENSDIAQASAGASGTRTVTVPSPAKNAAATMFQIALPTDTTGPTHATSLTGVTGNTYWNAGTVYYNGGANGSFTLNDAIADTGTGPKQVSYPAVSVGTFTHSLDTITTGPSYTSTNYQWSAGATSSPGAQTITGTDNGGNTSTATVTITNDNTPPSTPTLALSGGPWYTSASVGLTPTDGNDGTGSGVDTSTRVYERDETTLSNGSCNAFPGAWGTT